MQATGHDEGWQEPFPLALHRLLADVAGLQGVLDLLRLYVEHFGIFGASLWEFAEGVGRDRQGRMFLQSQHFASHRSPLFYHLSMDSISGSCIRGETGTVRRRGADGWPPDVACPEQMDELHIVALMILPLQLKHRSDGGADATITFYFQHDPSTKETT